MRLVCAYLNWGGCAPEWEARFLDSFYQFPAGIGVELVILQIGNRPASMPNPKVPVIFIQEVGFDLYAYDCLTKWEDPDAFLFLNSYSEILSPNWAQAYTQALNLSPLVGATGSWERLLNKQPFPNWHIRTNAFAVTRDFWNRLKKPNLQIADKFTTNLFEAGPEGMTQQALAQGVEPLVIDRFGNAWTKEVWHLSKTFRCDQQQGLLVADNRTRDYDKGSPEWRAALRQLAWGQR